VIGILAAILLPAVGAVRESAHSSTSISNLREIGNAVSIYKNAKGGNYPLLNRRAPDIPGAYRWPQALEEVVFEWDREVSGKHPVFDDPTADKHHGISDYGGNTIFFGDGNEANQSRVNGFRNVFKLERPSGTVVACTAHHPNSATNSAAWLVTASFASTGNGDAIPEARLKGNQVGLVFADGHVDMVDYAKLFEDADYRESLFDPESH